MRFILSFLLVFLCVIANAQTAPPMKVGGPQGIDVTRLLSRDWLSVPIYIDTPVAPLTGGGWPGAAYVIQATKNYRDATIEEWLKWAEAGGLTQLDSIRWQDQEGTVYFLPKGIDTSQVLDYLLYGDTSVWHYTGKNWRRVGGNAEFYFDYLLDGGYVTQVAPASSRQFTITPAEYYLGGIRYKYDTTFRIQAPSKAADSTGRIDVIFLSTTGPRLIRGTPSRIPVKPQVRSGMIELASIYFRPFDTIPNVVNGAGKGVSSIYRIAGRDSIYYTIDTLTFAIKDSIGISRTDTAVMLNPYKFTAANGLTKDSTVFRLGGSLNQNTNINLNTRRLTLIGGSDTTRFYANGRVSIGGTPDSLSMLRVNGTTRITGNTTYNGNLLPISSSGSLMVAGFTRGASTNDPARLQTYTNQGGAPTQYFNFRYFTTDLVRDDIVFDSVAFNYNFYNLGLNGIATSNRGGGNTFNSLLINPIVRIGAANTQKSYFRGVSFSPTIDSANNVNFVPFSNTVGSNMLNTTSGNTRIGYPLGMLTSQNTTAYDTTYKLDVNGNVRLNGWVDDTNVPGNSGNWGKNVGTSIYFANTVSDVGLKVGAGVDGTSRFILKNNGNIITSGVNNFGIGTITPTAKLHVSNNTDSACFKVEDRFNRDSATLVDQTPFIIHNNGDVSVGTVIDDTSSKVNIVSTTKGFLQPRMTNTQKNAIATPATGLQLFSTTDSANYVYRGTGGGWQKLAFTTDVPTLQQVTTAGNSTTDNIYLISESDINRQRIRIEKDEINSIIGIRGQSEALIELIVTDSAELRLGYTYIKENDRTTIDNIYLPDSSGVLTQRVAINGTTYNTATNGVIDMDGLWINGSATLDFPNTGSNNESDLTITVTGASEGDVVAIGVPNAAIHPHSCYTAWVSATNTVTIRFNNYGSGSHNPASAIFKVKVFK